MCSFVDLQKAFDTVDHQILLAKLNYYGIRGVSNDWFKSYLSNRNQYVSINVYESDLAALNFALDLLLKIIILQKRLSELLNFNQKISILVPYSTKTPF